MTTSPKTHPIVKNKKAYEKAGMLIGILVCNLALFLILGGQVIYSFIAHKNDDPMTYVKVKKEQTPKPKPPPKGGDAAKSLADPTLTVIPPTVSAPSLVVSPNISANFRMAITPVSLASISLPPSLAAPSGTGMGSGSTGGGAPQSSPFGSNADPGTPLLTGYMFDLKQTPDKQPTGLDGTHIHQFYQILGNFASNKFDESLLKQYYRTQDQLGVSAISIPFMRSTEAPKAFHVEKEVQASLWAVHYHCIVTPPAEGTYTFAGCADNVIVVAMDGKLLLDAGLTPVIRDSAMRVPLGDQSDPKLPHYFKGKSFHADPSQQILMDVLIADDGGATFFSLYLTKEGDSYETGDRGIPVMPIFQLKGAPALETKGPVCPPWDASVAPQ